MPNLLVAVSILTALWFICTAVFSEAMKERTEEDYRKMLGSMRQSVDTVVTTIEDYSRVISSAKGMQEEIKEYMAEDDKKRQYYKARLQNSLAEEASDIIHPTTIAAGMAVFTESELVYSGYDISEKAVNEIIREADLETAYEEQRPVWGKPGELRHNSPYNKNDYVFPVSKLIRDKNTGNSLGIVTLFISESYFSSIYENEEGGISESRYYIVDENGQIISSSDKNDLYSQIAETLEISHKEYTSLFDSGSIVLKKHGVPILYSKVMCENGWSVVGTTVLNDLVQEQESMQWLLLFVLLSMLIFLLVVSWMVARTVTRPVDRLLNTMNQIMEGKTEERAPETGNGEIALLSKGFNHLMDNLEESRNAFQKEQLLKRKNEFKLLQAQINPHFLYNTMETIASFIKLNMDKKALDALHSLSNFYRLSLSNGKEIITIAEEIRLTENYLHLQSMRYVEYMEYYIDVQEDLDQFMIPKLTIQPLVENAIYHGLKENGRKGIIRIIVRRYEESIQVLVYDNGKGIDALRLQEIKEKLSDGNAKTGKGFGLVNISQRLHVLYGDAGRIQIESIYKEFTEVIVSVPAQKAEAGGEGNVSGNDRRR